MYTTIIIFNPVSTTKLKLKSFRGKVCTRIKFDQNLIFISFYKKKLCIFVVFEFNIRTIIFDK